MSKITKLVSGIIVVAIVATGLAFVSKAKAATVAQVEGCQGTILKLGSTGFCVKVLQESLNTIINAGLAVDGKFGSLTKSAVSTYQANESLKVDGICGPITWAHIKEDLSGQTTPVSGGTTGTSNLVSLLQALNPNLTSEQINAILAILGGQTPTTPTTPTATLEGVAIIDSITNITSYNNQEIVAGVDTEVPVIGKEIKMSSSGNALLKMVSLEFRKQGSSGSTVLGNYLKEAIVKLNDQEIATVPVSNFTKSSSGVYTVNISTSALLNKGVKNPLVVLVNPVGDLNSDNSNVAWELTITSIRYQDASGAIFSESTLGGLDESTTHTYVTLSDSGTLKLRITDESPDGEVLVVDKNTNSGEYLLAQFKLKAQGANLLVDSIPVILKTSDNKLSDVFNKVKFVIGNNTYYETSFVTDSEATVEFDDLDYNLAKDSTVTVKVYASFKALSDYSEGATVEVDMGDKAGFVVEDPQSNLLGSDKIVGSFDGNVFELRSEGIKITVVSTKAQAYVVDGNTNDTGTFEIKFKVENFGENDVYIPTIATDSSSATDAIIYSNSSFGGDKAATLTPSTTLTLEDGRWKIPAGQAKEITLQVTLANPTEAGYYQVLLENVKWAASSTADFNDYTFNLGSDMPGANTLKIYLN